MRFPTSTRYGKIMETVQFFFIRENITEFPVDPFKIIEKNNWGLISYSEIAKKFGVSISEVIETYQSEDGYVIVDMDNYTIAYNDTIENKGRIRFTLMHEIGHIYLNHLTDFEETILSRSKITKSKYEILEREAHAFARNTLSPPFVINRLKSNFNRFDIGDIVGYFNISLAAAKVRLQMLNWDSQHSLKFTAPLLKQFDIYISRLINSKQCLKCSHYFIDRFATHCPICSYNKFSKKRGDHYMIYEGYETDQHGRVHTCPRCNNEEIKTPDEFCKICAAPVVNKCTNSYYDSYNNDHWECGTIADGNSRFCTKCGEPTVFFKEGMLNSWEDELKERKRRQLVEDFAELPSR